MSLNWELTDHAVERYRERCRPSLDAEAARRELLELACRAHRNKVLHGGIEHWRGPPPLRIRLRVERDGDHHARVITVLGSSDAWKPPRDRARNEPWQQRRARAAKATAAEPNAAEAAPAADKPSQAAAGSAVRPEDRVWAQLASFRRRVDHALETIRRAIEIGPIGVSFSGGKDSTVTLDLVRRVAPDAPCALFDSGCEMAGTRELAERMGAQIICPRLSMLEMARYVGWWGCRPVDADSQFDAKRMLLDEPCETFVVKSGLRVIAHGVRASESRARRLHTGSRGELYRGSDGTWYCMPLARWELADVWAYIADRGLPYHPAYDRMAELRIDRESWRISGALGERGSGWGRHETLRRLEPETWSRLKAEFPLLGGG